MRWPSDALISMLTSMVVHPLRWLGAAAAATAVVLLLALAAAGWAGSQRMIHPASRNDVATGPAVSDLPASAVGLLARDGTRLAALWAPGGAGVEGRATVVLLHGFGERKESMLGHAVYLHRAGYNVLLFDFRGAGESEGDVVTLGAREPLDVLGALDYLEARGDIDLSRVGLQGVSLGAAVAIVTAAGDRRVAAVVAEAPFADLRSAVERYAGLPSFPLAPVAAVAAWLTDRRLGGGVSDFSPLRAVPGLAGRPLLLIEDGRDLPVAAASVAAIFAAAAEPKQRWLAPGAEHARGQRDAPAAYEDRVLDFWERALVVGSGGE